MLIVSLGWSVARADQLESTLEQPLYEASHAVDVAVKNGVAIYKVRRVFANPGKIADEVRLDIDLPYGGAATGLRIRAREQWYEGELMEAEKAAKLYQELTGKGIWKPKDPALLYWRWADKLALQVFPVMPGGTSTVEYTLTVPTRYSGGRVFLSYPRLSADAAPNLATPVFTLRPGWGDATTMVKIDGKRVSSDAPIVLAAPVEPAWLAAIDHDASASYVASTIEIPEGEAAKKTFTTAKLTLDLEHTYKSDLRVALYTPGGVAIDVFSGEGGGSNDVRGTFDLKLPARTTGAGVWRLVVSDHAALDAGSLESWTLQLGTGTAVKVTSADTPVFIPDAPENASDGGTAMIELAPPEIDGIATRLGRVVASPAHAFGRLEIDAAPELRPLPRKAQVVFAIDASHSMGEAGIDAQLAIARAYLGHVGDAEVEVVVYRRAATRLFGGFVGAATFDAKVKAAAAAGKLAPGNGSALDEGARTAVAALAGRKGPLRIVMISDDLLRPRWDNALALAALKTAPAGTVVHLLDTDARGHGGDPRLERDDDHHLAPIPLAHHGILATLVNPAEAGKDLPRLVLGLVRPVQIDHFAVKGFDLEKGKYDETLSDVLARGRRRAPGGRRQGRPGQGRAGRHDLGRQVPPRGQRRRRLLQGRGGVGVLRGRSRRAVAGRDDDGGDDGQGGVAGDVVPRHRARGAAVAHRHRAQLAGLRLGPRRLAERAHGIGRRGAQGARPHEARRRGGQAVRRQAQAGGGLEDAPDLAQHLRRGRRRRDRRRRRAAGDVVPGRGGVGGAADPRLLAQPRDLHARLFLIPG